MKILGTRIAIQDALSYAYTPDNSMAEYLTYLCKIDKTKTTGTYQFAMAIQFAKIRAAINDQKQPIPAWLNYAYGPDLEAAQKARHKRMVALMLAAELTPAPVGLKRRERIEKLCYCAVEDHRLGLFLGKTLPQSEYAAAMDIHEQNWWRDWADLQSRALEIIKGLDSDGIGRVSVVVREIREAEEDI